MPMSTTHLPDIIHIGMPKSASTWLQMLFSEDPRIVFIGKSTFFRRDAFFLKGVDFYKQMVEQSVARSGTGGLVIESDEGLSIGRCIITLRCHLDRVTGKGFNVYFPGREADIQLVEYGRIDLIARRIHDTCPHARILIVVRNPVDLIISAYKYSVQGYEKRGWSLPEFLESEECREQYLIACRYDKLIGTYMDLFGNDKVKVLLFEDLKVSPIAFYHDLYSFLDLPPMPESSLARRVVNPTYSDAAVKLIAKFNRHIMKDGLAYYSEASFRLLPFTSTRKLIVRLLRMIGDLQQDYSFKVAHRDEIEGPKRVFRPSNRWLAGLLGRNLEELGWDL